MEDLAKILYVIGYTKNTLKEQYFSELSTF